LEKPSAGDVTEKSFCESLKKSSESPILPMSCFEPQSRCMTQGGFVPQRRNVIYYRSNSRLLLRAMAMFATGVRAILSVDQHTCDVVTTHVGRGFFRWHHRIPLEQNFNAVFAFSNGSMQVGIPATSSNSMICASPDALFPTCRLQAA
jgi:hypothetical protein